MADPNTISSATGVSNPLSTFQKIGYNTLLYTPDTYQPPKSPLILVFSWMGAASKHIAKYTAAYQHLFPSARILLVRCFLPDVFTPASKAQKLLLPAYDVLSEHANAGGEVLVQSFSNGGAIHVLHLAKLWRTKTGTKLPMRAQVIDSAPGKGGWKRSHAAMYLSLPKNFFWRIFGSAMIHIFLFLTYAWGFVTRRENPIVVMARTLNDVELFDVRVPRVYLYSRADAMVGDDEVEEHAEEAAKTGR